MFVVCRGSCQLPAPLDFPRWELPTDAWQTRKQEQHINSNGLPGQHPGGPARPPGTPPCTATTPQTPHSLHHRSLNPPPSLVKGRLGAYLESWPSWQRLKVAGAPSASRMPVGRDADGSYVGADSKSRPPRVLGVCPGTETLSTDTRFTTYPNLPYPKT